MGFLDLLKDKLPESIISLLNRFRRLLRLLVWIFQDRNLFPVAQSLSYATILSLVPIFAIFFSILTRITQDNATKEVLKNFIAKYFIPQYGDIILEKLDELSSSSVALLGLGAPLFVISCALLYIKISESLDLIWETGMHRKWYSNWQIFLLTILVAPVLLALSTSVPPYLATLPYYQKILDFNVINTLLSHLIPIFAASIGFYLLYFYLPSTSVQYRAAFWGAVFAGSALHVSNFIVNWYLVNFKNFNIVYGSLAIFPVFLIWIYIVWVVVLAGAGVSYIIQRHVTFGLVYDTYDASNDESLLNSAIQVVAYLVQSFQSKDPAPSFDQIVVALRMRGRRLFYILKVLEKQKIVTVFQDRTPRGNYVTRYQPAYLPKELYLKELVGLFYRKKKKSAFEGGLNQFMEKINVHPLILEEEINFQELVTQSEKLLRERKDEDS